MAVLKMLESGRNSKEVPKNPFLRGFRSIEGKRILVVRKMASPQIMPVRKARPKAALLISPFEQDHEILHSLFREQGWRLDGAASLRSGLTLLQRRAASLVITEQNLSTGNWKDVLEAACLLPDPPLVVVSSIHADDYLWAEALNLGAYDVLSKPIERSEAIRVFQGAWMGHSSSYSFL